MTIFIKPNTTNSETYYIIAEFDESIPILNSVMFAYDESEIIPFLNQCNPQGDDRIMFDATFYAQTGLELRKAIEHDIFLYRNTATSNIDERLKKTTANMIASQAKWITTNMHYSIKMKDNVDFQRFLQLIKDYKPTNPNCDSTAAELMSDAARYFRKLILRDN